MTGTEVTIFSYTDLAPAIRQDVECRTAAIRDRFTRQTTDAIASGRDLIVIKSKLSHGQWLGWLSTEFPSTPRTAQRFMAAAEWVEGKNDTVSHLPTTMIYLLSSPSTPPEITAEVVADLEAGKHVNFDVVKKRITAAKARNKSPNELAREFGRSLREQSKRTAAAEPKPMPAFKSDAPLDNQFLWAMEHAVAKFKKANPAVGPDLVCATINRLYWIIKGENQQKRPATINATCTDVTEQQDDTGAGLFE